MKSFVIQQAYKKLSLILIELLDGEESAGSGMADESSWGVKWGGKG